MRFLLSRFMFHHTAVLLGASLVFAGALSTQVVLVNAQSRGSMVRRTVVVLLQPQQSKRNRMDVAEFYYLRGVREIRNGDYNSSVSSFSQTKALLSRVSTAPAKKLGRSVLHANAYSLLKLRRLDEAESELRTLLAKDKRNTPGRYLLGIVLFEQAQKASIKESLDIFVNLAKSRSITAKNLGRKALVRYAYNWSVVLAAQKTTAAYEILESILRQRVLHKRAQTLFTYTALIHRGNLGHPLEAAEGLVQLYKTNPGYTHQNVNAIQAAAGFYRLHSVNLLKEARSANAPAKGEQALQFIEMAESHDGGNPRVLFQKYQVLLFLGKNELAEQVNRRISAEHPDFLKSS